MEGGKASAGQQEREAEKGKNSTWLQDERWSEELKNRHREHDRMTERKKGQRTGQYGGEKATVTGSGKEVWRKILRKRERRDS